MATKRELIYAVLEKMKNVSDDQSLTEEFIAHLIDLKREYLLHQKYSDYRRVLPEVVKQTIEFEMVREQRIPGIDGEYVLVSSKELPRLTDLERLQNSTILSGRDFMESYLNFIPYERFLYAGKDRWLRNQIYAALRAGKLYLKSGNFRDKGITVLNMTGVFSDPELAYFMSPDYNYNVDFKDTVYPLPNSLADTVVNMVKTDLLESIQLREDDRNNASPD